MTNNASFSEQEQRDLDDRPRSMRDTGVRERRRAMLHQPQVKPLTAYAAKLRAHGSIEVPDFDPLDGGVNAQVLFLFEKPGPMTANGGKRFGSGFVSRNNDDRTAEATFYFMQQLGIPRRLTVTWNLIPWWNGTRKVARQELLDGLKCLEGLIDLLPKLRAVVMVGRNAAKAEGYLNEYQPSLPLFFSAHPSPLVKAKFPGKWNKIPTDWAKVLTVIDASQVNC